MAGTKKELGQHWLSNRAILDEIAWLAAGGADEDVNSGTDGDGETSGGASGGAVQHSEKQGKKAKLPCAVEIGPGYLTSSLLKRFDRVVAVEYDAELARKLPGSFPGTGLETVHGDFLQYDLASVGAPYVVAGNIPYYITSPILEKVLMAEPRPERVVLLMQREVAERILDTRGSMLSLFVKNRAEVMAGPVVPKLEFTPPPKVDSQVLVMWPHAPICGDEVFSLMRKGFSAPRKKLMHNLAGVEPREKLEEAFLACGIDLNARPADLALLDWQKLCDLLYS